MHRDENGMCQIILCSLQHRIVTNVTQYNDSLILIRSLKKCTHVQKHTFYHWMAIMVATSRATMHKYCEMNHATAHSESCISKWFKVGEPIPVTACIFLQT